MLQQEMEINEKLNNFIVGDVPTVIYIPDFMTDVEQGQLLDNIYLQPASKWKALKNRRLQNWGGIVHEKGLLPQDLPPWLTKITQRICEESGLFPSAINHVLINEYLPNQGIMPHQDGPAYYPVVAILSLGSPVVMDFTPHLRLQSSRNTWRKNGEEGTSNEGAAAIEQEESVDNHHPFSVLLMPRSLLIFKDNTYSDYLHGIKDSDEHEYDQAVNKMEAVQFWSSEENESSRSGNKEVLNRTATRVSLTCRLVLKVHKKLFRF